MGAKPRLGYLGIGLMGEGMTRRLLDRGWEVTVWNRSPDRLETVVPYGAVAAPTPAAVAEACDILLVCVLHTQAVEDCVFGPGGVIEAKAAPKLLIDYSTIDPAATRRFAERLRTETGTGWVDAPISGGPDAALAGKMAVMAGGSEADIEAARPVMTDLAGNYTRMGEVGAGQTTKMVNQLIVGSGFVVMAEALRLAEEAGIDAAALPGCLAGGFANSAMLQRLYPQMQARAFDPPKSYARQLLKDLHAVVAFADGFGLDLPMLKVAEARYDAHVAAGNGMRDTAAIIDTTS